MGFVCQANSHEKTISSVLARATGGVWDPWFGSHYIDTGIYGDVYAIAVYNNELYIGGDFTQTIMGGVSGLSGIARWDGHSWQPVGNGLGGYSRVHAMAVYNNELYVGGAFVNIGSTKGIARWNGTTWNSVGGGISGSNETVYALMAASDGNLYTGGDFSTAGTQTVNYIAKWNGSSWSSINSIIHPSSIGVNGRVHALKEYQGTVFLGGAFFYPQIANGCIAQINNGTIQKVKNGLSGSNPYYQVVHALEVYNGILYIGGRFIVAQPGGIPVGCIAGYDKQTNTWLTVGGGIYQATGMPVLSMTTFNDGNGLQLYVGGMFTTLGSSGSVVSCCLAKWNGSIWSPVGPSGIGTQSIGSVYALSTFNSDLYVGGQFDEIPLNPSSGDNIDVSSIARYATTKYFVSDKYQIKEGYSDTLTLSLDAGIDNANRKYVIFGSLNCQYPGSMFPCGLELPFLWDTFTDYVVLNLNTPTFTNFLGTLDGNGQAQAYLNYVNMPTGYAGTTLYFTFALYEGKCDYSSSPIPVEVVN